MPRPSSLVFLSALTLSAGVPRTPVLPSWPTTAGADTIVVGHAVLRHAAPRMGADTTEVYAEREGKRLLVSTGVRVIAQQGGTYVVTFVGRGRGGLSIDTVIASASTFATIRHVEVQPGRRANLVYRNGHLTGPVTDSTGEHQLDAPVSASDLDFSISSVVMDVLPRSAGYEAVIRAYDVALGRERDVTFRVLAREPVTWHGHAVDTWKTTTDFGTHVATRWLSVVDGRELQWEITTPAARLIGIAK